MKQNYWETVRNQIQIKYNECRDYRGRKGQHILLFESDDWGSIRMSNRQDWNELLRKGYPVDKRPYERFDTLESPQDLEYLFEVLSRYKDVQGNHPIITANMLMVNPDFERIEKDNFQNYFYEPITNTYCRYWGDARVLDVMKQGMDAGVFMPQSHGREHFNVTQWMHGLQAGDEDLITAFKYGMCGIASKRQPEKGNQLMNALRAANHIERKEIDIITVEGLSFFKEMWGFLSASFVAPCYCWDKDMELVLATNGVKLIQTSRFSKPAYNTKRRYFYTGERNSQGIIYSVRNCHFEPSTSQDDSNIDALMLQVDSIFESHRIAVFSTHRINYVGGIDNNNRASTLRLLDSFLNRLLEKYPDVIFMSSNQLIRVL